LAIGCEPVVSNGYQYDITDVPYVSGPGNVGWVYYVSPCTPLFMDCDVCGTNAGYCQQSRDQTITYCVGEMPPKSFSGASDGKSLNISFIAPPMEDGTVREGVLTIKCDPNAHTPQQIEIHDPITFKEYRISYSLKAGCGSPITPLNCREAVTTNGYTYDLVRIQTVSGSGKVPEWYVYYVNPCNPLPMDCDVCGLNAGYCQQLRDKRFTFCVGTLPAKAYNGASDGKSLNITFVSLPENGIVRSGILTINCDPNALTPQNINFHDPITIYDYRISYSLISGCGIPNPTTNPTITSLIV